MLTACGFHLRGVEKLSPELNNLYIQSKNPNGQMVQTLQRLLLANKIQLAANQTDASSTLKIINVNSTQQATSLIGGGQAITYTITNTVTFSILNTNQKVIYGPTTVRAMQNYSSNASQALTSAHKARVLTTQLQKNLANQILQQLTNVTKNNTKALSHEN